MLKMLKFKKAYVTYNSYKVNIYCKSRSMRSYCHKVEINYPRRIFSGIQPTGNVHLGNYLGAIRQWVHLQNTEEEVLYSIADMHSITLSHNPAELKENILKVTATLLACGIDVKKTILFQQSSVSMHAELCWILGCITTMARLAHLPQYKEKSAAMKNIPLGLYIYPILQSADILLYRATHVPIGQDQAQHVQLAQDLARIFNFKFGETFPIPHTILCKDQSKSIKSLRDPSKKMSKSDKDPRCRLELTDKPDIILEKVKKSLTDCKSEVTYEPEKRPAVANLITIHSLVTGKSPDVICKEAEGLDTGKYKLVLADVIIEKFKPIQEELFRLFDEPVYLHKVLKDGTEKAIELASDCWFNVQNKVGFRSDTIMCNMKHLQKI